MKNLRLFLACGIVALSTNAMAQDFLTSASTDNYLNAHASFVASKLNLSTPIGGDFNEPKGFAVGATYGYNVTGNALPLFLEGGAEVVFVKSDNDFDYVSTRYNNHREKNAKLLSASVPVNVAYHFCFGDITVAPKAGLNFKFNLSAKYKVVQDEKDLQDPNEDYYYSETINLFDEEMEDLLGTVNRFQMGGNVGVDIYYKNFILGYKYNAEITKLGEDPYGECECKLNNNYITIGYSF